MNNEELKTYLQQRLGEHQHPVDEHLWEAIAQSLPPEKKKRRGVVPWGLAIGLCAAASVVLAVVLYTKPQPPLDTQSQVAVLPHSNPLQPMQAPAAPWSIALAEEGVEASVGTSTHASQRPATAAPHAAHSPQPAAPMVAEVPSRHTPPVVQTIEGAKEHTGTDTAPATPGIEGLASTDTTPHPHRLAWEEIEKSELIAPGSKDNKLSLLLARGEAADFSLTGQGADRGLYDGGHFEQPPAPGPSDISNPQYDTPISYALLARLHVGRHMAVESGLVYTRLGTKDTRQALALKQHYVGIPLKLVHTFAGGKWAALYGSAGVMIEMQVAGTLHHATQSKRVRNYHPQLSVNASLGVEARMGKHLALFLEPGLAYYFDDQSQLPNIRREHPTNISLVLGLRVNVN